MNIFPLFASGDPVLFLMLGGVLVLAGATIGLGVAGIVMLFGKSNEKKQTGKRLIVSALIPVVGASVWWIIVVGFD